MADEESEVESLNFLPENLRDSLLDFQKHGVQFGIRNQGRCLVGDEMGLGKTLQALSIAYYYKNDWPALIVVPSSMKYPWIEEIEKWLTDLEPGDINLIRSGTDISNIATSKINILGYGLCIERKSSHLLVNALKEQAFKLVVLDESHYLKNRTTGRTKLLHPIAKSAKRTILLSGTPSLARPEELYAQLDMVRPGEFGSFSNYATRYCEAHYEFIGKIRKWNTRGACNLEELYRRLHNGIMIRRLKKNVLTQLPPKRRQKITFDIPDSDYKKDLLQAKNEFKQHHQVLQSKESQQRQKTEALFELNRLSTVLYHYTGLAKAGSVQQYISDLLDGMENKFIVFCRHKQVVTAVIQQLAKKSVRYICIDGSVGWSARGALVQQFQNNPNVRVAVLAIEAASFGITLTAADHVVFAELHYTPGIMMQAEDRAHRIGQVNAVNVHYLVGRGTLDEVLWSMLKRKIYVTSSALDGKLDELHAEDGDEQTAKQLSACAAWLNEETEEGDEDSRTYLFSQTKRKATKQIEGQSDLRSFFTPPSKTSQDLTVDSDDELMDISLSVEKAQSSSSCNNSPSVIINDSSGEEELCDEDDLVSMLVEDSEEDNGPSTNQDNEENTTPTQTKASSSNTSQDHSAIKKSVPSNACHHFYEFSEYVDSEDIFQSYIQTSNDIENGGPTSVDEEEASSTSSTLTLDSGEEDSAEKTIGHKLCDKQENKCDGKHSVKDCDKEEQMKNKSFEEKKQQRNPFSLEQKDASSPLERRRRVLVKEKITETDSDDDDFLSPMPKPKTNLYNVDSISLDAGTRREEYETYCTVDESSSAACNASSSTTCNTSSSTTCNASSSTTCDASSSTTCNASSSTTCNASSSMACNASSSTTCNGSSSMACNASSFKTCNASSSIPCNASSSTRCNASSSTTCNASSSMACSASSSTTCNASSSTTCNASSSNKSTNASSSWSCNACTFINDPQMVECSICFTPRQDKELIVNSTIKKPDTTDSSPVSISSTSSNPAEESDKKRADVLKVSPVNDDDDFKEPLTDWSCSACTFLNDAMLIECSVCMTPKRRSQRKTPNHWSTSSCEQRWRKRKRSSESTAKRTNVTSKIGKEEDSHLEDTVLDGEGDGSSLIEQRSGQKSRKRLHLESNDISSAENRVIAPDQTQDITNAEEYNLQSEKGGFVLGKESGLTKTVHSLAEQSQNPFLLELSDSDATDDEHFNMNEAPSDASLQDMTVESIALDTSTPDSSTEDEHGQKDTKIRCQSSVKTETATTRTLPPTATATQSHTTTTTLLPPRRTEAAAALPATTTSTTTSKSTTEAENTLELNESSSKEAGDEQSSRTETTAAQDGSKDSENTTTEQESTIEQSESLQELQEAAAEIFGGENEFEDDFEELDSVHCKGKKKKEPKDPPKPMSLKFAMSLYTDRVFLYDESGTFLKCNFLISDVKDNSKEDLPHILQHEHNFKQAKTMVRLWTRLGPQMQRIVVKSKMLFKDPMDAYQVARGLKKEPSKVRHWNKEICLKNVQDTADLVGGDVRKVIKSPERKRRKKNPNGDLPSTSRKPAERATNRDEISCMQAFGPDGLPLCLFCRAPVDYGSLGNNWDSRFCSFDCKESYQMRISGTATRRQLFDAEQGICQLCHFDAHAFFTSVKALQKKDRRTFLENSIYADLPPRFLNRMILDPKEGMFWEADHIVAVAEGGGECGIENLRTLCVPCHKKVTKDLLIRLKNKKRAVDTTGSRNITGFFKTNK